MSELVNEIQRSVNDLATKIRAYERQLIVSEIQAFAGEYGHEMTKDGATRDVVIVEQLLDFLISPKTN